MIRWKLPTIIGLIAALALMAVPSFAQAVTEGTVTLEGNVLFNIPGLSAQDARVSVDTVGVNSDAGTGDRCNLLNDPTDTPNASGAYSLDVELRHDDRNDDDNFRCTVTLIVEDAQANVNWEGSRTFTVTQAQIDDERTIEDRDITVTTLSSDVTFQGRAIVVDDDTSASAAGRDVAPASVAIPQQIDFQNGLVRIVSVEAGDGAGSGDSCSLVDADGIEDNMDAAGNFEVFGEIELVDSGSLNSFGCEVTLRATNDSGTDDFNRTLIVDVTVNDIRTAATLADLEIEVPQTPETAASVPGLNAWGMSILSVLLAGTMVWVMQRRTIAIKPTF